MHKISDRNLKSERALSAVEVTVDATSSLGLTETWTIIIFKVFILWILHSTHQRWWIINEDSIIEGQTDLESIVGAVVTEWLSTEMTSSAPEAVHMSDIFRPDYLKRHDSPGDMGGSNYALEALFCWLVSVAAFVRVSVSGFRWVGALWVRAAGCFMHIGQRLEVTCGELDPWGGRWV